MYTVDFSLKTHTQSLVYLQFHCHRQRWSNWQWWEARGNRSDTVQTRQLSVSSRYQLHVTSPDSRRMTSEGLTVSHLTTSDVKRGQNFEAEAEANFWRLRPRPRPKIL